MILSTVLYSSSPRSMTVLPYRIVVRTYIRNQKEKAGYVENYYLDEFVFIIGVHCTVELKPPPLPMLGQQGGNTTHYMLILVSK